MLMLAGAIGSTDENVTTVPYSTSSQCVPLRWSGTNQYLRDAATFMEVRFTTSHLQNGIAEFGVARLWSLATITTEPYSDTEPN